MAEIIDLVASVRAFEPRIDEIDEKYRIVVAGLMADGTPFEDARAKWAAIFDAAASDQKQIKEERRNVQENTTKKFFDAILSPVRDAAFGIPEVQRPKAGWTLVVSYDYPQKNPDGSPKLDEKGNPVLGFDLSCKGNWSPRTIPATDGASGESQRGRVSYVQIDGRAGTFENLKAAAKELGLSADGNVRSTLESNGYSLKRETDSNGKSRFVVSKTAGQTAPESSQNGQQTVPAETSTQQTAQTEPAF